MNLGLDKLKFKNYLKNLCIKLFKKSWGEKKDCFYLHQLFNKKFGLSNVGVAAGRQFTHIFDFSSRQIYFIMCQNFEKIKIEPNFKKSYMDESLSL